MVRPKLDTELLALDGQLGRLKRIALRLQRGVEQDTAQWTAWSSTLEDAFGLVDHMMRISAEGPPGLAIKITAIVWFLQETDAVLDVKGSHARSGQGCGD